MLAREEHFDILFTDPCTSLQGCLINNDVFVPVHRQMPLDLHTPSILVIDVAVFTPIVFLTIYATKFVTASSRRPRGRGI
jgi:hypothetical protein